MGSERAAVRSSSPDGLFHVPRVNHPNEWLTPPDIIKALGPFDLDPCAPINRPWPTAGRHYTIEDNGLQQPWEGRVWLNPPFGRVIEPFMRRMAEHQNGIALVFARTDTAWFQNHVFGAAKALFFVRGRIAFHLQTGVSSRRSTAGVVLVAYGWRNVGYLPEAGLEGRLVML